jgi:hypothetical protein
MLVFAGLAALLVGAIAVPADADTVLSYTGSPFTTVADPTHSLPAGLTELNGSLTLSAPLGADFNGAVNPLAFSFADGSTTISNLNGGTFQATLVTDHNGQVISWAVKDWVSTPNGITEFLLDSATPGAGVVNETSYFSGGATESTDAAGAWSATPEPGSLVLLGIGLTALTSRLRGRRSLAESK